MMLTHLSNRSNRTITIAPSSVRFCIAFLYISLFCIFVALAAAQNLRTFIYTKDRQTKTAFCTKYIYVFPWFDIQRTLVFLMVPFGPFLSSEAAIDPHFHLQRFVHTRLHHTGNPRTRPPPRQRCVLFCKHILKWVSIAITYIVGFWMLAGWGWLSIWASILLFRCCRGNDDGRWITVLELLRKIYRLLCVCVCVWKPMPILCTNKYKWILL